VISVLIESLSQSDRSPREEVIDALGNTGARAEKAVPKLVTLLDSQDFSVYLSTVRALVKMGKGAKIAVPKLTEQLQSSDSWTQFYSANALRKMGEIEIALPTLIKLLDHPFYYISSSATVALGEIGKPAEQATPKLVELLKSKSPDVRRDAASALVQINRSQKAIRVLTDFLEDSEPMNQVIAASSLVEAGQANTIVIFRLIELLQYRDPNIHDRAIDALAELREKARPFLLTSLKDANWQVRANAAKALGRMGESAKPAIPQLISLLQDEARDVRSSAAEALKKLGYQP
jgi:HEAT repeat protein